MDHPAALHRLKVGVRATVEHGSQKQPRYVVIIILSIVLRLTCMHTTEFHHFHGRPEAPHAGKGSTASALTGACHEPCTLQGKQALGRSEPTGWMASSFTAGPMFLVLTLRQADYAERDESIRRNR
jgi:hypothetical protein